MMRILFLMVLAFVLAYFILQGSSMRRSAWKPIFLQVDEIAGGHSTDIQITLPACRYLPDSLQLAILKQDYSNIWAHLNHVYATNDILSGKEYYTENWFRQLAGHYKGRVETGILRADLNHELQLENWSSDGLVCTAIDNNVILSYYLDHSKTKKTIAKLAVVLLNQGDHWRLDALKVLDEVEY